MRNNVWLVFKSGSCGLFSLQAKTRKKQGHIMIRFTNDGDANKEYGASQMIFQLYIDVILIPKRVMQRKNALLHLNNVLFMFRLKILPTYNIEQTSKNVFHFRRALKHRPISPAIFAQNPHKKKNRARASFWYKSKTSCDFSLGQPIFADYTIIGPVEL